MGLVKVINITDIADILQIYCRYITADYGGLWQIAVDYGKKW